MYFKKISPSNKIATGYRKSVMTRIQNISWTPWHLLCIPHVPACFVKKPVHSELFIKQLGLLELFFVNSLFIPPFITHFILINDLYILTQKLLFWIVLINWWISYVHSFLFLPCPSWPTLTYYKHILKI